MKEGINFVYDGIHSNTMGLINVTIDGGMFDETFLSTRSIVELTTRGKEKPYFQDVTKSPIEFSLTFAFKNGFDKLQLRKVARWLNQDYYKPFYIADEPERIYYCMPVDDTRIVHNGVGQGYITLNMRCDSPYSYSPKYTKENMVFSSVVPTKSIVMDTFNNESGLYENTSPEAQGIVMDTGVVTWERFRGMKWSEVIG